MTPQQRLALLGAVTLIVLQRTRLEQLEANTAELLESYGAQPKDRLNAFDTVLAVVQEWSIDDRFDAQEIAEKIADDLRFTAAS